MNVLVTGASGFLGGHIVDRCLAEGWRVRALVRAGSDLSHLRTLPTVELVQGDLLEGDALSHALRGMNAVVHSAARVTDVGTRRQFLEANVEGTALLLEKARSQGLGAFVFISSPSVVMNGRDQVGVDESCPYPRRFLNYYSESKALAEMRVLSAHGPGFSTCSLRPRAIWGPRDKTGFFPKIVDKMRQGRFPDASGGRPVLASLCHCDNAAEATVAALKSPQAGGNVFFVTDNETLEIWTFARRVARLFDLPPLRRTVSPHVLRGAAWLVEGVWKGLGLEKRKAPPLTGYTAALLTRSGTFDTSAAMRTLGYRPVVQTEEGLMRLKAWVDSQGGLSEFVRHVG